jgi:hypothetical protein
MATLLGSLRSVRPLRALALVPLLGGIACASQTIEPSGEVENEPGATATSDALSSVNCAIRKDTGYVNGNPYSIEVVTVDGKPVERATANAYYVMAQAASRDGVTLRVVSGFRTNAEQKYLRACYENCNCNNCNLAARPGYSNHQSGHALDLNASDPGVLSWLRRNAGRFGFDETVPSENWHWEWYSGGPGGGICGATPTPEPGGDGGATCEPATVKGAENELFKDLPKGALGYAEAKLLFDGGITSGCSASPRLFCPTCGVTRAQLVAMLVRAKKLDLSSPPTTPSFSDVPKTSPFYASVEAAKKAGITSGCATGRFCPDDVVTRAQAAGLIGNTLAWPKTTPATPSFGDVPKTNAYFGSVETFKQKCVSAGCGSGNFCPDKSVTRSETAVFIARAFDLGNSNSCF